jgi:membrane protease YdiL (CAAX protease family)
MSERLSVDRRLLATTGLGAGAYLGAIAWLAARDVYPIEEALGILLVLGLVFPLLAWGLLRGSDAVSYAPAPASTRTNVVVFSLLALVTCYLTVGAGPLEAVLPRAWLAPGPHEIVALLRKLIVFVALPWAAMRVLLRWRVSDFGLGVAALRAMWGRQGVATLVLALGLGAFQWFVGQGAAPLRAGELAGATLVGAIALSFAWHVVEAGLVEEFFFRAVLQTRLAALAGTPAAGAILAALVFGIAHAPGYVLRGGGAMDAVGLEPSVLDALAYGVAVPSVAAILFALLWARTRNLYACMLVHGAIDALPNAAPLARAFGLH